MKSIFLRQFSTSAVLLLMSFSLMAMVFFPICIGFVKSEKRDELRANAESVAHSAMAYHILGDLEDNWDFRMSVSATARAANVHILVSDIDGKIIACSDSDFKCGHVGKVISDPTLDEIIENGGYTSTGTLDGVYVTQNYIVGHPISSLSGSEYLGMVFVSTDAGRFAQLGQTLSGFFILIAILVLFVAFFFTTYASQRQTRPLMEMAEAAHRFAHGQFNVRVRDYGRRDEVGQLAIAFNAMADSLEHSEIMRREFVSNVSHELRTPMTTIGGFIDGILDGTIPREREEEYLRIISAEIGRLTRLIRSMLEVSSLQAQKNELKKKPFDITELLLQTLFSFEQKATAKKLEVETNFPRDPMMVLGDPDSIYRVIYNLLDNAVKFSNEGGTLTLEISKKGNKAFVTVQNIGETISPEQQSMIFERFHKSDASRSADRDGVGLGLYIVRTILNNHGEDIKVESSNGKTAFTFTLALANKKP